MQVNRWVRVVAEAAKGGRGANEPIVLPAPITLPVSVVTPRPVVLRRTMMPFGLPPVQDVQRS